MGGAFLGLLWPRLTTTRNRVAALLGAAVALCLVPLTPAGVPVLAASVVALGLALMVRAPAEPAETPAESAHPVVRRAADLLPIVLLAALVAVQVFVSSWRCCCGCRSWSWSLSRL